MASNLKCSAVFYLFAPIWHPVGDSGVTMEIWNDTDSGSNLTEISTFTPNADDYHFSALNSFQYPETESSDSYSIK